MSVLTQEEEKLVAESERIIAYLSGFDVRIERTEELTALVRKLASRVEELEGRLEVKKRGGKCEHEPVEFYLNLTDEALDKMGPFRTEAEAVAALNFPTGKETPSEPTKPAEISRGGNEECCPHDASDHDHHGCTQYEWDGRPCECECARPSTPTGEETP